MICRLKAITGSRISWSGLHSSVPSAQTIFWPRLDIHSLSERQVVSPALVAVPQAWHRLNQTGGQPVWGLMRLKPHQRLGNLSSLQSTCATLSVWWELKLRHNSPSSCNYSNSWFVITQIICLPETFEIPVFVWMDGSFMCDGAMQFLINNTNILLNWL